jgi:hypothetical protein
MGNFEACRIVGISRSSGTRWRHGDTVVLKSGETRGSTLRFRGSGRPRSPRGSLRVVTGHDRGPVACAAQHPCNCPGARTESVDHKQRDPPQPARALWQLRSRDGPTECRAQKNPSADRKDRRQPRAAGVCAGTLGQRWSPRQISNRLRAGFPGGRKCTSCPKPCTRPSTGADAWTWPWIQPSHYGPGARGDVRGAGRSTEPSASLTWS